MKDIDELNKFITDTFVPIFERSDALPESILLKINETPYLRDVVLSSLKIVNKSQQSILVYENVILTPFTLSDILFDKLLEIELPEVQVGQGKYDDIAGGNSVNFVNGFSIPRNIFTLDFVTLVRKSPGDFKEKLKKIIFAINSKTGAGKYYGNYEEMIKNATFDIDFVISNKDDIEKMIKIPEDIKQQIENAQKANN